MDLDACIEACVSSASRGTEGEIGTGSCDTSGQTGGDPTSASASVLAEACISVVDASVDASCMGGGSPGANGVPQLPQKRAPSGSSLPHSAHVTTTLGKRSSARYAEALAGAAFRPAVLAESCRRVRYRSGPWCG